MEYHKKRETIQALASRAMTLFDRYRRVEADLSEKPRERIGTERTRELVQEYEVLKISTRAMLSKLQRVIWTKLSNFNSRKLDYTLLRVAMQSHGFEIVSPNGSNTFRNALYDVMKAVSKETGDAFKAGSVRMYRWAPRFVFKNDEDDFVMLELNDISGIIFHYFGEYPTPRARALYNLKVSDFRRSRPPYNRGFRLQNRETDFSLLDSVAKDAQILTRYSHLRKCLEAQFPIISLGDNHFFDFPFFDLEGFSRQATHGKDVEIRRTMYRHHYIEDQEVIAPFVEAEYRVGRPRPGTVIISSLHIGAISVLDEIVTYTDEHESFS